MKSLLELRKKIKRKKPEFLAQDVGKKKRIRRRWVKPRGLQSKMRLAKKGYRKSVKIGYGSPAAVHGLDKSGLKPILTYNLAQLSRLDKEKDCVIIPGTVGLRTKNKILTKVKELGLVCTNVKSIDEELSKIKDFLEQKKKTKEKTQKDKQEKLKAREEAAKKKEAEKSEKKKGSDELAEKVTEEAKQKEEKKKIDKILTKKGAE
jgi:large subunit ribosomal protein L32e